MPNDTPIPDSKTYVIKQACYSIALDVRAEDPLTPHHAQRLQLANLMLQQTGNLQGLMAEIAEASKWGVTINWETVENNAIKSTIADVWDDQAMARFGEDAV